MVVTQPDRPAGRGRGLRMSPVKQLALQEGLRIEQPEKASTPEFVASMKKLGVEIFTVAAFGQILRAPLLEGLPCMNVHASLLPKYRGAAPIERAIMAGERETGVSIMDITPKVDTGAVYLQRVVPIMEDDDAGSMYEKLGKTGGEALAEVLDAIEAGGMSPVPQDDAAATYVEKITPADRVIDWSRRALEIAAQVRGLAPHIGAFTNAGDHRMNIWKARVTGGVNAAEDEGLPREATGATTPGEVTIIDERLIVTCGEGVLEVLVVQPEGKRRMSSAEYLRGHRRQLTGGRLG